MNSMQPHTAATIQHGSDGALAQHVAWSPDGRFLAVGGSSGVVEVWSVAPLQRLFTYRGHRERIAAVAWSPDGTKIASTGPGGVVRVWDARSGQDLADAHWEGVQSAAWSPDGRGLALLHIDGTVRLALWPEGPQHG